jgi:hypothetical protein
LDQLMIQTHDDICESNLWCKVGNCFAPIPMV